MPKFDSALAHTLIAESRIGALSLDTQALREQNYNLNSPAMIALRQFGGTSISLILSEIVVGEIRGHVAEGAADAKKKLGVALKEMRRKHFRAVDESAILSMIAEEPAVVAEGLIAELQESFGFRIHPIKDYVDVSEVMRRYFQPAPPFDSRSDKKSEFPDAIALLSLEAWATEWKVMLLVVSRDVGWRQFADESANLICVDEIATALDLFNQSGHFIAERVIAAVQSGEAENLCSQIGDALKEFVDRLDPPEYDAWSHLDINLDFIAVDLEEWTIDKTGRLRVLEDTEDKISFVFDIELALCVTGHFEFSVSDKEDIMPMGTAEVQVSHRQPVPVAVTVSKDALPNPDVYSVGEGTLKGRFVVRFGDIEPNDFYGSDDIDEANKPTRPECSEDVVF